MLLEKKDWEKLWSANICKYVFWGDEEGEIYCCDSKK